MRRETIWLSIKGFSSNKSVESCHQLLKIIQTRGLKISKCGDAEDTYREFVMDDFLALWRKENSVNFKGKRFEGMAILGPDVFAISFFLSSEVKPSVLLDFTKDLYDWQSDAFWGHVGAFRNSGIYLSGRTADQCLPGVSWANLFGKPYVDAWGEEKVKHAPAYQISPLHDGGCMIVTSESPFDDPEESEAKRESLRDYLGRDYFFVPPDQPVTLTRDDLIQEMMHPKEKKKYLTPDFARYYKR